MRLAALLMVALSSCAAAEEKEVVRAYLPVVDAQQSADRLVRDEDELRQALWDAINPNRKGSKPSTIRLGANITLTRPIQLSGKYDVIIEGGGRYSIGIREQDPATGGLSAFPYFESENGFSSFTVRNVSFLRNIGSGSFPLPGVFNIGSVVDGLTIDNCTYTPEPTLPGLGTWVRSTSSSAKLNRVFISTPSLTDINSTYGSAPPWTGYIENEAISEWVKSVSTSGSAISRLRLAQNQMTAFFDGDILLSSNNAGSTLSTLFVGQDGVGIVGPLFSSPEVKTLSGVDPEIDYDQSDFAVITLDATTSGDIEIQSPSSTAALGKVLEILFLANNGTAKLTNGVYGFRGNGDFTPVAGSTIRLRSYGSTWYEMARTP